MITRVVRGSRSNDPTTRPCVERFHGLVGHIPSSGREARSPKYPTLNQTYKEDNQGTQPSPKHCNILTNVPASLPQRMLSCNFPPPTHHEDPGKESNTRWHRNPSTTQARKHGGAEHSAFRQRARRVRPNATPHQGRARRTHSGLWLADRTHSH